MRRTERELTDVDIIDAFQEIIEIIIKSNQGEVEPPYRKESRCAQVGHKIETYLVRHQIIEPGEPVHQKELSL